MGEGWCGERLDELAVSKMENEVSTYIVEYTGALYSPCLGVLPLGYGLSSL